MKRRIVSLATAGLLCLHVLSATAQEGQAQRGWLGVTYLGPAQDEGQGVQVEQVHPRSPAAEAGIREGDLIIRWNGETAVRRALGEARLQAGDTVRLRLRREGADREMLVIAAPRPAGLAARVPPDPPARWPAPPGVDRDTWEVWQERLGEESERMEAQSRRLLEARERVARATEERLREAHGLEALRSYLDGVRWDSLAVVADSLHRGLRVTLGDSLRPQLELLQRQIRTLAPEATAHALISFGMRGIAGAELEEMNDGLSRYFGTDRGLLVLRVSRGTPADRAGLEAGDVVIEANDRPVASVEGLRAEVARAAGERNRAVELEVLRGRERRELRLTWE